MLISEFFANHEIFITGGSGFIGKALIEKLLRSCPDVGKIFILMRSKKGKNAVERLEELLATSLFNRLREEQPDALSKVHVIDGDCAQLGLGISAEDLVKMQNVSIVYHSAASVRFDDHLRDAILLNTRGTFELVKIAEGLKHLKAFVHVSTTYCNPHKRVVDEDIYPPYADWRTSIKLAETYSTETLNILNLKYGSNQPNTYTFTKSMAEHIINDYKDKLPVTIFRPSIVISSIIEPVPGWVDNFNGPIGLFVACGIGILRTNYGDPDVISDYVPVDIVVRGMLIAAYKRVLGPIHSQLEVFNCTTSHISPMTTGRLIEIGKTIIIDNPFEQTLWPPGGDITPCWVWNLIRFIMFHILPAIFVDILLRCSNKKPFLVKLQRRIYAANLALHHFIVTSWIFKHDNFVGLDGLVPKEEIDTFGFMQFSSVDHADFFRHGLRGAKEFLLKESPDASKEARLRFKILQAVQFFLRLICGLLAIRFVIRYANSYLNIY